MTTRKKAQAIKTDKPGLHVYGKAKTPRTEKGKFAKGVPKPVNAGRPKGGRNRTTTMLKDAILKAAELSGQDGRGKDGMVGYLRMLASKERPLFSRLLEKVLPMQLDVKDTTKELLTPEQAADRLRERGLPVPPSLLQLTAVAQVLISQREGNETDGLDNLEERDGLDDLEEN